MNDKQIIYEIIKKITNLNIELKYNESLVENGILDSMTVIQLINLLEEKFNISFKEEDIIIENFETINQIYKTIRKYK
ncbi:MAG TPA: acyl carrier protein [bacterium]|nr:acyl carrier protein [bacterium]HOL48444.1 acyl carrier protein [bacterium]HPQ19744.1 acyl carrier protein [bacterium]